MAETISNIIAYTVTSVFILAHVALFGWGLVLAGREAQRAAAFFGTILAVLVLGVAGCTRYIAN